MALCLCNSVCVQNNSDYCWIQWLWRPSYIVPFSVTCWDNPLLNPEPLTITMEPLKHEWLQQGEMEMWQFVWGKSSISAWFSSLEVDHWICWAGHNTAGKTREMKTRDVDSGSEPCGPRTSSWKSPNLVLHPHLWSKSNEVYRLPVPQHGS